MAVSCLLNGAWPRPTFPGYLRCKLLWMSWAGQATHIIPHISHKRSCHTPFPFFRIFFKSQIICYHSIQFAPNVNEMGPDPPQHVLQRVHRLQKHTAQPSQVTIHNCNPAFL